MSIGKEFDISSIVNELKIIEKNLETERIPVSTIFDDRVPDPEVKRVPLQTDNEGNLYYPKYVSDDEFVIAIKDMINKSKTQKTAILNGGSDFARRWNLLYNLCNNRSMKSKTFAEIADLFGYKVDVQLIKIKNIMEVSNND